MRVALNGSVWRHGLVALLLGMLLVETAGAAVGRIEADFGVSANGGAAYTVPIRATEGIAGMTPRLAVSYVGAGHRSLLGMGFDLAGLSVIAPCAKTIAQDTTAAPVTLSATDRYCLDGARLRLVSGTYGASGSTYRTEIDQLARITSNNSTSGVPGWFKVETRDGLTYEYGNTTDSLMRTGTGGTARSMFWALNKVSDRAGNTITLQYDSDATAHRFRPSLIRYSNHAVPSDGAYTIEFVYQGTDQPDPWTSYLSSSGQAAYVRQTRLLQRLELKHQGTIYRQYLFSYATSPNGNSRLTSIAECAVTTGDCLPATTFGWQDGTPGLDTPLASAGAASSPQPLDLNNDGYEDLVWAQSGTWRTMLGGANGYASPVNTGITATNPAKALVLDWDGDGFEDLLVDWSDSKWRVLRGTPTGLASPVAAGPGSGVPSNTAASAWWVADINGDHRDDLLRIRTTTTLQLKLWVRLGSATGFGSETVALDSPYFRPTSQLLGTLSERYRSRVRRADFNGDGNEDLLVRVCEWDAELGLCLWSGWVQLFSQGTTLMSVAYAASDLTQSERPMYGDFNADKMTDFVYRCQYTGTWCVAISLGEAGYGVSQGPSYSGYLSYLYLVGDYDGDGIDDLYAARSATSTWEVIDGGLGATTATSLSTSASAWTVTDPDGDGLADLGYFASSTWRIATRSGVPADVLTTATDGLGNAVTFSYRPMSDPSVYTRGSGSTYPVQEFQSFASLVRTLQVSPAGGTSYTLTYAYANARLHTQGRGFLGMGQRTVTDGRNSVYSVETYRQDFPYIGAADTTTVKQPGGTTLSSAAHSYTRHDLDLTANNQRYLPYRSQTIANTYEAGGFKNGNWITQVTDSRTVNALGNTTAATVTTVDKDSGSAEYGYTYTTTVAATYKEDQTYWCLAVPLTRSETRTLPNANAETRSVSWSVDGPTCRVTQQTVEPGQGSTLSLVTDLGYDAFGNVSTIASYPAGQSSLARTTTLGFGTRGQSPETVTNPLGQVTTLGYDYALGVTSSQADPNGLASTFEYDSFGRLTRQVNVDGTATRVALTECNAGNGYCGKAADIRIKVTQTARSTADGLLRTDEQYLDGLGRGRFAHADSLESGPAIVETRYDVFGRVSQRSQPYFAGGSVYWTSFSYDLLGRLIEQDAPVSESVTSGRITGLAYAGRDLQLTDPLGRTTTRTGNVLGQLRAVVDPSPGGTTTYGYRPFGELASITDANGNVTGWSYNLRGFTVGTSDPDAGAWTYEVNAFGELTKLRDAKTVAPAWTTQYTYDKLSRPLTRLEAEGTTTFTWGTSAAAKNIGRLASVTSPGGYTESYTYDSLARPSQQSILVDGTTYLINRTYYSTTGLPATLEYPTSTSGYRLKLGYDYANNLLQKVRDYNGSTIFWQATSTDAWGHVQDETFGNGVATFSDYDQASGWLQARQGGLGGGTGLINATASWDQAGNLTQRQDLKQGVTEQFWYDALDRFDYSKRNGVTNADVTLDAIGNITWKMGIGSYTYHATKKRAVIQAGSHPYGYDANGNLTSRDGSTISYTSYNLPSGINAGSNSSTLSYGAFRNRSKQVAVTAGITETTIYVGGLLEKVTKGSITEYRHRIEGGAGLAALYTRRSSGSPLSDTYYVHSDHLGSPELMTNSSGASVIKLSFGAYGERRDSDWDGAVSSGDMTTIGNTTRTGFTGHEHLDAVGLIHMNGRVYDPLIGRFLSRDPLIAADGSGQAPNGYAYVRNNPLARIDPSGLSDFEPKQPFSGARSCVEKGLDCDLLGAAGQAGGTDSPIPITPFDPINIVGARNDTLWASFNAEIGIELRSSETGFAAGGVLPIQDASKNDGDVNPSRMTCTTRLPDSRTVAENVNQMRSRAEELLSNPFTAEGAYAVLISEWMTKVAPGGGWDYKLMQGGTDEMGNFNYGATGSLLLPAGLLVRIGGSDQIVQHLIDAERHPYSGDWGTPLDPLPRVGDDPDDTKAILAGADGCR